MGVDQLLAKLFQIDPRLTFDVFHILNDGRISKIEKNIRWSRPHPKNDLFGGGSLDVVNFGYVSDRKFT